MSAQRARRINAFLTIADEELAAAQQLASLLPRQSAYFLQQSVEKLARAVLELEDIPAGPTHNLRYLADLLGSEHPLKAEFIAYDDLTPASTRYRYPSTSGGVVAVRAEDVAEWLKGVEELHATVKAFIGRRHEIAPVKKDR